MPLMSAVSLSLLLLSASFAAASLSPAVAQSAGPTQQAAASFPRCHQAARGGTGGHARAAAQGGRTAAKTKGRYRGDRTGPLQAQPATDRHRHPGAHRRDPHRRDRGRSAPARQPRAAGQGFARFTPHRNRRGAGGAATRRPAHAAGAAGPARRRAAIAAHRHAARIGRPRTARTRGETCRRSRRARECAQDASPPSATCWRGTATG